MTIGLEVRAGDRIIECADKTAELHAASARGEAAAFAVDAELGNARSAAVREELNDAGNGVGAVDGAFGAAHDFDLVNVVQREAGKINGSAGRIYGRAIDQDFGEVGIAAVQEYGGGATERSRAADGDTGRKFQKVRQGNGLAIVDGFAGDDVGGRGGLLRRGWNGLRGYDDAVREGFELEIKIQDA